jgi:hypothetical protein
VVAEKVRAKLVWASAFLVYVTVRRETALWMRTSRICLLCLSVSR